MSLLRRRMMMATMKNEIADDNLIDMEAYSSVTSGQYHQMISVDISKTYYTYEIHFFACYNSFGANLGIGTIDDYGKVTFKDGTVKINIAINAGRNPYFGLTQRS